VGHATAETHTRRRPCRGAPEAREQLEAQGAHVGATVGRVGAEGILAAASRGLRYIRAQDHLGQAFVERREEALRVLAVAEHRAQRAAERLSGGLDDVPLERIRDRCTAQGDGVVLLRLEFFAAVRHGDRDAELRVRRQLVEHVVEEGQPTRDPAARAQVDHIDHASDHPTIRRQAACGFERRHAAFVLAGRRRRFTCIHVKRRNRLSISQFSNSRIMTQEWRNLQRRRVVEHLVDSGAVDHVPLGTSRHSHRPHLGPFCLFMHGARDYNLYQLIQEVLWRTGVARRVRDK